MPSECEHNSEPPAKAEEKQLCLNCTFPNDLSAHFCAKCGAPLSSYAATAPFESVFAEGFAYRKATESPHNFTVVLGIWIIFGMMALASLVLFSTGDIANILMGAFSLLVSLIIIWKTTRSYFRKKRLDEKRVA